jgi:ABC-2 type transport system permease protein
MFSNVFRKTVYEKRWTMLAWSIGLFFMALLTMSFYPFFKNSGFDQVIANAPKSLQGLLGQAADYKSVPGYVDQQIFALRMPLLTIIMSITLFFGIGIGDEDRGTLETLLAQPVSRTSVYLQKFMAGAALIALASIGIIHGSVAFDKLLMATFGCWLLSLLFGTLAYAAGAITGKRGVTIAISSVVAFGTYLISSMAPAVDKLASAVKLTPFYYYNTPSIAVHGLKWSHLLVLGGTIAIMGLVGLVVFKNRDLVQD